jgi:hypothetical protein
VSGAWNTARAAALHLDPPTPLVSPNAGTRTKHAPTAQPKDATPGTPGAQGEREDDKAHTQQVPVTAATKLERCTQDLMQRYQTTSNTAKHQLQHTCAPCSEGCSHALDLVETGWSLDRELEEAPVHLHEQEVITALLPATYRQGVFTSKAPDATMDATPHPASSLAFHAGNIRGLWSSEMELQRHTTLFSPFIMLVSETKLERHDHRSTGQLPWLDMVLSKGTSVDQLT